MPTLTALRSRARNLLDDNALPYGWSDAVLDDYLNEAQEEAAIRASLLHDAATDAVTLISVTSGTASYALDSRIIDIISVTDVDQPATLVPFTMDDLVCSYGAGWQSRVGTPIGYLTDAVSGQITLFPAPDADTSIRLEVYRRPLVSMAADGDTPEIPAEHHFNLVDWALWRAYSHAGTDDQDLPRADRHLAVFDNNFGDRPSAKVAGFLARGITMNITPTMYFNAGGY